MFAPKSSYLCIVFTPERLVKFKKIYFAILIWINFTFIFEFSAKSFKDIERNTK